MEALISSYVEEEIYRPQFINLGFRVSSSPRRVNSIVISKKKSEGVNQRILSLLKSYRKLENNWDYDDALAPSEIAINRSEAITLAFQNIGQKVYHSAPGPNGEVMLDLREINNSKSIEIIVYNNKTNLVYIPEQGIPTQEDFEFSKLKDYLNWLNK
jgi:hypothetical protein